jgi:hypothetical protein
MTHDATTRGAKQRKSAGNANFGTTNVEIELRGTKQLQNARQLKIPPILQRSKMRLKR